MKNFADWFGLALFGGGFLFLVWVLYKCAFAIAALLTHVATAP